MKKFIIIIASLLVAVSAFGQNAKELYKKYSDRDGITAVYVSPAMFRMIGRLPEMNMDTNGGEKVDLSPVVKSLSGFYLLDADDTKVAGELFTEVKKILSDKKYELLLEAKDNGETIRLYTIGNDSVVTSLILISKDKEEFTFMGLEGSMDREELENLLAESAK